MVGHPAGQASLIGRSLGNYTVKALIGRGALGTVYLATDVALNRPVALKALLGSLAHNPDHVKRFLYEAQAAAPLRHPNIVGIYEAGIREGTPFIAMEYVEGEPLDRFLRRRGKPLHWQNALHIALQVAEALDCAHGLGITHRDVKPANILLDHHGRVRLSDFGIARLCQDADNEDSDTGRSGSEILPFKGTPDYMSPEQCRGDAVIGLQADLYSLGVTLYQMITGRMPFESRSTIALINAILTSSPPRLTQLVPGVPDDVARLVAHLMEKEPAKRPASARAVCEMIQRLYRENGGASAVPEALNSFIREESEPRRIKADTPAPRRHGHTSRTEASARPKTGPLARYAGLAVGALILVAVMGMGVWRFVHPLERVEAAPRFPGVQFSEEHAGRLTVSLPMDAWRVHGIHWVGGHPAVLVDMTGAPETLASGGWGWLAIDLAQREVTSPRTPTGSALDPEYARLWAEAPQSAVVPDTPEGTPLHDVRLANVRKEALTVTLAQPWNAARPQPKTLYRPAEHPGSLGASVAVKPDGHTLCALAHDRGDMLLEFDAGQEGAEHWGIPLTESGLPIDAESVHYSSDGIYVAYIRVKNPNERELWVVASGGQELNGKPLALGRIGKHTAFNTDASLLALTTEINGEPHIRLVHVADGGILADLGSGEISSECWHPSGRFLVVCLMEAATGKRRLEAIEAAPPYRGYTLFEDPTGSLTGGAVSRDGRWAVAAVRTASGTEIQFIDLSTQLFKERET